MATNKQFDTTNRTFQIVFSAVIGIWNRLSSASSK